MLQRIPLIPLLFLSTIPLANWMIGHVGACQEYGPCLIPIFPGIMAPSGVLVIGAALVLRDLTQRRYGIKVSWLIVAIGALLSALVVSPVLALASAAAFLFSETVDFLVYTPLAKRRFVTAVFASSLAGALVDSALFLFLAFGSFDHVIGLTLGKAYAAGVFVLWQYGCRKLAA